MSARIRIHVAELRVVGAAPLDAQRLRDALERSLAQQAPALADALQRSRYIETSDAGRVAQSRPLELAGPAIVAAIVNAVSR